MLPFAVTKKTWIASLSFSLTMVGAASVVSAAEPGVAAAARLEVKAAPGCTSRAELIARVRSRSPRARFSDDSQAITIRADFAGTSAGLVAATVSLAGADAKPSVRRVLAASCSEAADAVALIIAVTLDPSVASGGGTRANDTPSVDPSKGSVPVAAPATEAKSAATDRPIPSHRARAPDVGGRNTVEGRNTLAVQVAAQALLGPAPKLMPGIALYAMFAIERPTLWSPAILLGASHAWRAGIDEERGTAAFTLDAASLDACPFRFRWGPVVARPCGSVLIGRLSARGSQTRNPAAESGRLFAVVGGAAVATVDLTELLELTARVAVGANLVRDSFVFTPVVFHEVPALTATGSLGVGMRFH
jgi:hypothetical protein